MQPSIEQLDLTPPDNYADLQLWLVKNFRLLQEIHRLQTGNYFVDTALRQRDGHSPFNVDGYNPDVDTTLEDIIDFGGTYTYSTTADITHAVSDNAADTFELRAVGLDANWDLVEQVVTLTGTTAVAWPTPMLRIWDLENNSPTLAAGIIQAGVGATTSSFLLTNLRAQINLGTEHTLMAQITTPRNKWGMVTNFRSSIGKTGVAVNTIIQPFLRRFGRSFRAISPTELNSGGTSHYQEFYGPYPIFPPQSDIKVMGLSSAQNTGIQAGFDIVFVDQELVNLS